VKPVKKDLQIAIDGPISVGKSSLALLLSRKLNILYIYTGAMYRAVAFLVLENNIDIEDEEKITRLLKKSRLELKRPSKRERYIDVYLNGKDITSELFSRRISKIVAYTSRLKKVRDYLVDLQRKMAQNKAVVMEGRDIGTLVLPDADLKIFLTAEFRIRVQRRWLQLQEIGKPREWGKVEEEIRERDRIDTHRKESPLKKADDAWILDTTNLSIPQTINKVIEKLKEKGFLE